MEANLLCQNSLDGIIKEVESLPVALNSTRLQLLLNDDNSNIDDIINVTRADASLVTQLIKISNSDIPFQRVVSATLLTRHTES